MKFKLTLFRYALIMMLVVTTTLSASADSSGFTLNGTVKDENGEPLVGVTIKVNNGKKATSTDLDGKFTLTNMKSGEQLSCTYVGFNPVIVKVTDKHDYLISMKESTSDLDEVVVVGYGSQKKANLTGAVSVVQGSEVMGRPAGNAALALQGADPSFYIQVDDGSPGADVSLNIRGIPSINGGSPLVLVDGVEMSLTRLNANDIESVSILKDASAAAIYGAKASAGVVLVTTKTGNSDSKAKVSFDLKAGWKEVTTNTNYMSSGFWQMYLMETAYYNDQGSYFLDGYGDNEYAQLWMRLDDKVETAERPWAVLKDDKTYKYYANYNWYEHFFRKRRPMQDYNLSISGGTKKLNYYVSGRAQLEDGMLNQNYDKYKSYSFRSKINANLTNWLKYHVNASLFTSEYYYPTSPNQDRFFYQGGMHTYCAIPARNPDGTSVFNLPAGYMGSNNLNVGAGFSAMLNEGKTSTTNKISEFMVKNGIDITPFPWWTITAEYAYLTRNTSRDYRGVNPSYSNTEGEVKYITEAYSGEFEDKMYRYNARTITQTINAYMEFDPHFGNHNLKATVGFNGDIYRYMYFKAERSALSSEDINSIKTATGKYGEITDNINNAATYGFFGRINYDYEGKYLAEVSARYDGTSRFPKNSRWGFFPSASVGWRFSEEKFFEPLQSFWSNGKLRASYGSLGNQQVGYYDYLQEIETNIKDNSWTFDGKDHNYYSIVGDPVASDLTWEKVITYDLGLDLGFFNNKLSFTGDLYIRDTKDMLTAGQVLPTVYGASVPDSNSADMRTKGYDFGITWNDSFPLLGSKFSYSVRAGFGDQVSKITKFDNPDGLITTHYVGQTLGEIWGYHVEGLFKTEEEAKEYEANIDSKTYVNSQIGRGPDPGLHAGDMKFIDLNGDGAITPGASKLGDTGDRIIIGNNRPRYKYNFRLSFNWKGFDVAAFFQGVGKRDIYFPYESRKFWGPYCRNFLAWVPDDFLDRVWSEDNPDGYFPRLRAGIAFNGRNPLREKNDYYMQSAAYLRLKNVTIGYTIPVPKKILSELRVYFSTENPVYWSPLTKHCTTVDPEAAMQVRQVGNKSSGDIYGFSKTFTFGLNITL